MQKHFIYGLFSGQLKEYFYVGRSIDIDRRLREHKYESRTGTEAKYQFIRALDALEIPWHMELLAEVNAEDEDFEDFYVYKLILEGHPLQNQKMGDAKAAAEQTAMDNMRKRGEKFTNPQDFLTARQREIEEEKARKQAEKLRAKIRGHTNYSREQTYYATLFENEQSRPSLGLQELIRKRRK